MTPEEKRERKREALRRWRERNRPEGKPRRAPSVPWTDVEDAVLIASELLTMQQISDLLDGRSKAAVQTRIQELRKRGVMPQRKGGWKGSRNPFHCPKTGILVARSCIRCGEFQPADLFGKVYEHGRATSVCRPCQLEIQDSRRIPLELHKIRKVATLTEEELAARTERKRQQSRERNRRYAATHSEELREKYWSNRDVNVAKMRVRYQENREEILQVRREQRAADPVLQIRTAERDRDYRKRTRDYQKGQDRKKYQKRAAIGGDNNKPWTDVDDATVLRDDITVVEVVYLTGRTYGAVAGRRGRLLRGELKAPSRHRRPRTRKADHGE